VKPTFLILGAPKCGTTTLHALLGAHPDVFATPRKEPPFFDAEYQRGPAYYWNTYFADWRGQTAAGEARACKLYLDYVAPRIRESLPDARLIVMLRDPVGRAYSHWWDRTCRGAETLRFHDALRANARDLEVPDRFVGDAGERRWRAGLSTDMQFSTTRTYLDAGHYALHLTRYLALFPASQVCAVWLDELMQQPQVVLSRLWEFLGVAPADVPMEERRNAALTAPAAAAWRIMYRRRLHHVVPAAIRHFIRNALNLLGRRPSMSDADRDWLRTYYAPHDERLRALLRARYPDAADSPASPTRRPTSAA
jgi:hypothetical protein